MQGFKSIETKGVRIGTQQFLTMDFTLAIGNLQESVTVEGNAAALETSNASVASSLDKETLQTLPTAGRNAFFLAVTTASVVPSGDPQFVRQQDQTNSSLLSLGGGPRRGNNYTLDGVSIVDTRNRATFIPHIESVEEVKVQVSTYDGEMGRTGGGVFNTTGPRHRRPPAWPARPARRALHPPAAVAAVWWCRGFRSSSRVRPAERDRSRQGRAQVAGAARRNAGRGAQQPGPGGEDHPEDCLASASSSSAIRR